jgi:REP element-mobilizing transposase RayT
MNKSSDLPRYHRKSIRLSGYDYRLAGAYFVTICTHERLHLFGKIHEGTMQPNRCGLIVQSCWDGIPMHFPFVELDAFVLMPNHLHGILVITDMPIEKSPEANGQNHGDRSQGGQVHDAATQDGQIHDVRAQDRQNHDVGAQGGQVHDAATQDGQIHDVRAQDRQNHDVGAQYIAPPRPPTASQTSNSVSPQSSPNPPPSPTHRNIIPNYAMAKSLGSIIRSFKAAVTRQIGSDSETPIWQRNYYDHIVRNEADLDRIRTYIIHNPARWREDSLYGE